MFHPARTVDNNCLTLFVYIYIIYKHQAWAVVYLLDRCLAIPLAWIDGSSHAFIIFSVLGGQMEQLENYVFHIP